MVFVVVIQCLWMVISSGLTEKLDRWRQKWCLLLYFNVCGCFFRVV